MDKTLKKEITHDKQVIKFCLYGLFKDIRFFDAYLILYFLISGFSLLQIGVLVAVREAIIFIFEIPSGIFADRIGRKVELCICFVFYIISFVFFFFAANYTVAIFAMVFFGLGEAFRSGSHKAMIYTYLDMKGWTKHKTFVYGRTRSWSLIGAGISSVLGVVIAIFMNELRWVFAITIIPYILDFILILSYPKYLNYSSNTTKVTLKENFSQLKANFKDKNNGRILRRLLIGEGVFESSVSLVKNYIQPAFESIIVGAGILVFTTLDADNNLKLILGIVYAVNSLAGAAVSKNSYRFTKKISKITIINAASVILLLVVLSGAAAYNIVYALIPVFLIMYCLQNLRKPVFVDKIDDYVAKCDRATILSVCSGLKSMTVIILSPLLGYFADTFGIQYALYSVAVVMLVSLPFSLIVKDNKSNAEIAA